ncbi:MAG: LytTR family transcriptional regulator [Flavobacteriales bacterium]|nr:LytTR family transcriptional regulator [Flavobacteriales bacterium]
MEAILKENSAKKSFTITIKSATKIEFVQINDIIYCNADEGYTDIQLMDGRIITASKPLTTFEKLLQEYTFFRISKSHLINTNHIIIFHKNRNQILLQKNILLDVARRRRVEFLKTVK